MMKQREEAEAAVARRLTEQGLTLSVAESCTGGLLSARITSVAGASNFYKGGACTYCNEIKVRVLGVRQETLDRYTAVSPQTAEEMALGCTQVFGTDLGVGITGYAGPDGGEDGTPAGTIYVGVRCGGHSRVEKLCDPSGRAHARETACERALSMILEEAENYSIKLE